VRYLTPQSASASAGQPAAICNASRHLGHGIVLRFTLKRRRSLKVVGSRGPTGGPSRRVQRLMAQRSTPMRLVYIVLATTFAFFLGVTWGSGQSAQPQAILSGADIGFRVERRNGETPIGTLVVRVDGKWVAAQFAGGVKPALTK
jgi:hypothetical protein